MTYTLILLRHGESEWNAKNLFTGWVDVRLSNQGEKEAASAGTLFSNRNLLPEILHTSLLRRAIHTAQLALDTCDRHWIPVRRSWRLNERHYGALQGKDKKTTLDAYGEEQLNCGVALTMFPRRQSKIRIPLVNQVMFAMPSWAASYQEQSA